MKGKYGRFNKVKTRSPHAEGRSGGHKNACAMLLVMLATVLIPWGIYTTMHPRFSSDGGLHLNFGDINSAAHNVSSAFGHTVEVARASLDASMMSHGISLTQKVRMPVQGPVVTNGFQPLWGTKHQGGDAIFALAANYKIRYYQRFVGTLRDAGYTGDIVLAVTPLKKMAPGVAEYLQSQNVVAYPFEVQCLKKDNCKFNDDVLGYPDPRPHRTFANIRYALYEYWLNNYKPTSYILILDFRDTFFQANPFKGYGYPVEARKPKFELQVFAENYKVKSIRKCVYNSLWIGRCFGKPALEQLKDQAVLCSGSTLGSFSGIDHYVATMLRSMDEVRCWLKGIESDQGYHNFLYYNGHFNTVEGNATFNHQGYGVVNTIGAMNGHRVPKELKGPLDTFWHVRDAEGYIINYDGSRSAVVHQWDRYYSEIVNFLDQKLLGLKNAKGGKGRRLQLPLSQS